MAPGFWSLPYPSRREPVLGDNVVATSQPLATQAGLSVLARGGNAVDAAIAAAMALTVVEPTSNGIGGDLVALVAKGATVHGLNASGRSPAALDVSSLLEQAQVPARGWDAVTVPGAVSGWVALAERFGTLPLSELVEPAARYAERGFPVGPVTAAAWAEAATVLADQPDFAPFLPGGQAPRPGQRFAFPAQAASLREIAATSGASFYTGRLAEAIAAHARSGGGALSIADLAAHEAQWVQPLRRPFEAADVTQMGPNTQGVAVLIALGILDGTALADCEPDSLEAAHLQIEATKLALAACHEHVADPVAMTEDVETLLDDDVIGELRGRIDPKRATDVPQAEGRPGGTVYLCAADASGLVVSLIQSNYMGFGSGIVVPGTGIALHNRGAGFTTDPRSPNVVAAGKRPFTTIIPGLLSQTSAPLMAFGVMGGSMQAQGHVQMTVRTQLWGQNPQAAVDAPRWRVLGGDRVAVEDGISARVARGLVDRGHDVVVKPPQQFGGAQAVMALDGAWLGASDWRKEGLAGAL